ncbi:MAG: DMT family transporter [Betaproteobacteria bacterium]|nr:DMT family transporter [Betaproteobacteria bacterium]
MNTASVTPSENTDRPALALLLMVGAHFCFSLMILLIKAAQKLQIQLHSSSTINNSELFGTWESVLFRCLPMTLICLFILVQRSARGHKHPPLSSEDTRWLLTRGVVGAISMACFFHGTLTIPLALSSLFANSSVFLIGLLAHIFLGERLTSSRIVFALAGLAGVALVLGTGLLPSFTTHSSAAFDYLISFCSGLLSALAYFSVRKMKTVPSNTIILSLSASGVLLALLMAVLVRPLRIPEQPAVLALLCLSSLPAIAAQYLMTWSFQTGEAGFVALGQYSGPVFAAILGVVAFGEFLTPLQWLGAGIAILFGVMMPLADDRTVQAQLMSRPKKAVQILKERIRAE